VSGNSINRIGVLTGGGDCPGLNAVIRAVVKTANNEFGWEVFGIEDGFDGLVEPNKVRPLSFNDVRGILPKGGTILGSANRGNPFARCVVQDGQSVVCDMSREAVASIKNLGLDALIVVGGEGTLGAAKDLADMGAPIIGVPKTIDNDLSATDVTFGFDTALTTATEAIDKLHTTAESHHRVMVVEVMGRNAGWIALHAGLAGGADVILIPEIPFDAANACEKVHSRARRGSKFSIVVAAEGASPADGQAIYQDKGDALRQSRLGGIGNFVAQQIAEMCGNETRCTVLGHLQRGGSPTAFDRILGTRFGSAAVRAVANGKLGTMVALQGTSIGTVPLAEAVRESKRVVPDGELVRTAHGLGIVVG
jgi:6-phosphofructokinase 1